MLFNTLKTVVEVLVSLVACMAIASLFDRMNWPLFHSWALMHGSFFLLFPLLFLLVHLIGKGLDSLFRHGNTTTSSVTSYTSSNWKTFVALFLGFIGFMIPFISVGGLVLGLHVKKKTATGVDKGLLNASLVVSSLGSAFALYMILTMLYIVLLAPKP